MQTVVHPKPQPTLKQLRHRAQLLKPIIWIGQRGLHTTLINEVDQALAAHQLIKIKLPALARTARLEMQSTLSAAVGAQIISLVGRASVLYRARVDNQHHS